MNGYINVDIHRRGIDNRRIHDMSNSIANQVPLNYTKLSTSRECRLKKRIFRSRAPT